MRPSRFPAVEVEVLFVSIPNGHPVSDKALVAIRLGPATPDQLVCCRLRSTPEPCECCGTDVVLVERDDEKVPIWHEAREVVPYLNRTAVTWVRHDAQRCRDAGGPRA